MLTVSRVSLLRALIVTIRGAPKGASAGSDVAIDVQQLNLGELEIPDGEVGKAAHQVVAELMVGAGLSAQALTVEADHPRGLEHDRVEMPAIRFEQPRPSDGLTFASGRDDDGLPTRRRHLDRHPAVAVHLKGARRLSGAEHGGACREDGQRAAARELVQHRLRKAGEDSRLGKKVANGFDFVAHVWVPPALAAASRVNACASSVMSMATGHHA